MLKDVYVATESCRSAFDLLHEYLPVFLARHMELSASAYDKDEVAASWRCIGVGADWVDLLAEVNPVYRQGKLFVSDMVHGKIVSADQVGDLLLYIFRFSNFSTTRWCSVGKSCRSLFAAVSVGLLPLALLALQLNGSLETKLHGVKKLNDDIRWYLAVASIVTWIPEAFELAVAEDDRICRRLEELEEVVQEELDYVFRIEKFVWQRLAFVAKGLLWEGELMDACLQSCHLSVAFLAQRVFSVARALPWSLTLGDVEQMLVQLQEGQELVIDPVTQNILRLLELGRYEHSLY